MPTIKVVESFQHRVLELANTDFWSAVTDSAVAPNHNGNEITFDTTIKRTADHACSLKIAFSATLATLATRDIDSPVNDLCGSFYFRTDGTTNPGAVLTIMAFVSTSNAFIDLNSTGQVRARIAAGSTATTVNDYCDGNWHRVDWRYNASTTSGVLDVTVDGGDAIQSTGTVTVANITSIRLGHNTSQSAYNVYFQDLVAAIGSDYPLGDHICLKLEIAGTGTHSQGAGAFTDEAGNTSDAELLNSVDDAWNGTTPELSQTGEDYVQQTANDAAGYVEFTLAAVPIAVSAVWGAGFGVLMTGEDSSTAANCEARLVDSGGTTLDTTGLIDPTQSATAYSGFRGNADTAPSGGWSESTLEACKIRFGFSTDAAPDVIMNSAIVEYVGVVQVAGGATHPGWEQSRGGWW